MRHFLLLFFQRNEEAHVEHFAPEIALVERFAENGFVQLLELPKRKLIWQQLKPNRVVAYAFFQAFERLHKNLIVVETKLWNC